MAKKLSLNVSKTMSDKISYQRCYEEHGIIETENNIFTCAYEICRPLERIQTQYNVQLVRNCMESILTEIVEDGITYQFCVRNKRVDTQDYLKDILISKHGEQKLDSYIESYNETIRENTSIGHNNFETKIYYIISCTADIVEDAIEHFTKLDEIIIKQFSKLYGYVAKHLSLQERLESIFDIYHPEKKEPFGTIVDYDGKGFSFHSMQLMKLSTKDLVAPTEYDDTERSFLRLEILMPEHCL